MTRPIWIDLLRDTRGAKAAALRKALDGDEAVLTRFTELELLQGCADERSWLLMREYLDSQDYLEMGQASWPAAARIYFDLRRLGRTVRSPWTAASPRSPSTTMCRCCTGTPISSASPASAA